LSACSFRYMKYRKAVDKLKYDEITSEEFDKKFYKFKKEYIKDTSGLVKFKGAYVYQDDNLWYRFYKFSEDGRVSGSLKMPEYPNSISMIDKFIGEFHYRISGNIIELEFIKVRDWDLFNNIISGYVSGDTIFLTEIRTVQTPWLKPDRINRKCVYDSTLTAEPL